MDIIKNAAEYDALLKENKAVFVDFYADWCGPCKMAGPVVEQLSKEYTDVKFVKVNVDDNPDIAQRYGIMSIPTMIANRQLCPSVSSRRKISNRSSEQLCDLRNIIFKRKDFAENAGSFFISVTQILHAVLNYWTLSSVYNS